MPESKILNVLTIDHAAHEPFWQSMESKQIMYPGYKNFKARYTGALKIPRRYNTYTVENLLPLAYLKYNPLLRNKKIIAVAADGLPYVYKERPEWYYNPSRHDVKIPRLIKNFYLEEMRRGLKIMDGAVAVSPLVKNHLSEVFDGPIEVCLPALSEEKINLLEKKNPSSKPAVFSVVKNSEWKGIEQILEAFKIARKEIENLELNLRIGENIYQEHEEELEDSSINVYREWLTEEEYAELAGENQLYLQASYFEPFGVAVAEAMTAGLTPLVTDKVGAKCLFEDDFPSLVRKSSAQDLANGIIQHFEDKNSSEEKSGYMREAAKRVYPDNVKEEFKESFEKLVENQK